MLILAHTVTRNKIVQGHNWFNSFRKKKIIMSVVIDTVDFGKI